MAIEVDGETAPTGKDLGADSLLVPRDSQVPPDVSVVLPTLDEAAGIGECIDRITDALAALEVTGEIIVSDGSSDGTADLARERGAVVVEPDREGYGYAYRYAFAFVRGEYVVIGDADTTYDFGELPTLYHLVAEDGADMALGSRLDGEIKPGAMPALHRYVGNPLLTRFLNVFYGVGVSDAHSGFRVIEAEALDALELTADGMEFASEMIMEAGRHDLEIAEAPITYHERAGEPTLDSFRDGWRHVKFMLVNAPGYLFTGPAIGLGVVGVALLGLSFLDSTVLGVYFGIHTAIAGSLLAILGYQVGSLSVFSAVATDPIREPQDPVSNWVKDHFRLEHGGTLGLVLFLASGGFLGYLGWGWVASGYSQAPFVVSVMVGFTALILGVQTIFYSFFLSLLGQQGR